MILDQKLINTKQFLVYATIMPTTRLLKNKLGNAVLNLQGNIHYLEFERPVVETTLTDVRLALFGIMPNEPYTSFEDLDADVFVYDTVNVGNKTYKYIDETNWSEIKETFTTKPDTQIYFTPHPSRLHRANTILRSLISGDKLVENIKNPEFIDQLIQEVKL